MDELALIWLWLRSLFDKDDGSDENHNNDEPGCGCGCLTFIIIAYIVVKLLK